MSLMRLLSSLAPVRLERVQGKHGPLELTLENGRLVVNSAHANQSFGSLHRVWQHCFADIDLVRHRPDRILLLGFGAGSVAHILRQELGIAAPITAVDNDPAMLDLARVHFGAAAIPDLTLLEQDARLALADLQGSFDLVIVDLFQELNVPPELGEDAFMDLLRARTLSGGTLLFNTIAHDAPSTALSERIGHQVRLRFASVSQRRYEGDNRVFIAR
jgi:spermidine synthase